MTSLRLKKFNLPYILTTQPSICILLVPTQATKYLQNHIDQINEFLHTWKLKISSQKTQAITFARKRIDLQQQIVINDFHVPWTNTVKYLDLTPDKKLTWARIIEKRTQYAHLALSRLYPLISNNSTLPKNIKILQYPIITYGCQIWASAPKSHINKAQIAQNKFLRIILNKQWDTNIHNLILINLNAGGRTNKVPETANARSLLFG